MTSKHSLSPTQLLRKTIRQRRNTLSDNAQHIAAAELSHQLLCNIPDGTQRIAIYLASDGEINPIPFIEQCWQQEIEVYLPVLHPFSAGNLLFLRFETDTKMTINKYGINEPKLDITNVLPANKLDIIYTPLVAFDAQGNRMGMGGGYYDRTLAANLHIATIGIAHDCQQVDKLQVQPWDMPLQKIITPTQVITPLNSAKKEV